MTDQLSASAVCLPSAPLRRLVARYAGCCVEGVDPGIDTGLPSRHVHLIVSLRAPIRVLQMPGSQAPAAFRALVGGLHDVPAKVVRAGSVELVHVFLTPLGARAILGVPIAELTSHVFELSDLWGRDAGTLVERLETARTWPARFAILDETFLRALAPVQTPSELTWAWDRLACHHGRRSIDGLAREVGWSRRHFSERFRLHLGVTPKTAARIFRFERACAVIRGRRPPLADVAFACGYHDQAHLTREWHVLAGCTPRAWIAGELPFLQDYELEGLDTRT